MYADIQPTVPNYVGEHWLFGYQYKEMYNFLVAAITMTIVVARDGHDEEAMQPWRSQE